MLSSSSTKAPTPTPTTTTTASGDKTSTSTNNTLKLNTRLSSSSSSSSSSSCSFSKPTSSKTMEEVWKEINLASLNEQNTRPISTSFGGIMFQDFLARPFTINDPPNTASNSSASDGGAASLYCAAASPTPHPLTALSLGSHPEFHHHHFDHHTAPSSKGPASCSSSPFDALPCSSSLPCFGSKRFPEPINATSGGDRRNKRMIKNRESAARSRARKQAYTNELQLKVDHLLEENARLKRQQQQLCEAAASQQKKRSSLYRTSTF